MKSFRVVLGLVLCCAASLFVAITYARADSPARQLPSIDELPAACRAAKAEFNPLTRADLQEVKAELVQAVTRLDRRLSAAGDNGADWREYLQWDRMQNELQGDGDPDLSVLDAVYKKYTAGHEGLELVWFVEVRMALQRYRAVAHSVDNPKFKPAYEQLLDALATHLQAYAAQPTAEGALVIGRALGQLEDARQAPALVRAIRHHLARPNLFLEVSAEVISAGITGPVDETAPVRDVILGTDIYGTGQTTGRTSVELFPDARYGVVDTVFLGITKTDNVGYHGPVRIYSNGTTRIGARKRLWINATGLASLPAVSKAVTESKITGIRSNRGSRFVERMAWKRAAKQKALAEWIASRHAEQRVNGRIDSQAAEMLGRVNEAFAEKFRQPLLRRRLFPQQLCFSTTDTALHVLSLQADGSQLAAPSPPPQLPEQPDLALRVHQSMVNNLAASALSGMTLRYETYKATVVEVLGELPERMKAEEDQEPWAIDFARRQPISVKFADGKLTVTVRGRGYYKGKDRHPGMNVTAVYKILKTEQGFKGVRQGELQIFPPGFVPGSGKTLSTRQIVIRKLLETRFGQIFKEEMVGEGLELPGKWGKLGKMKPGQLVCKDGWLTVTWKRVPADQDVVRAR